MYWSLNGLATAANYGVSGNAESQLMTEGQTQLCVVYCL